MSVLALMYAAVAFGFFLPLLGDKKSQPMGKVLLSITWPVWLGAVIGIECLKHMREAAAQGEK